LIKAERTAELEGKQGEPQIIMEAYQKEVQLKELVTYVTGKSFLFHLKDYLRFVIENGKEFKKDNFFMMLKELNADFIDSSAQRFLQILADELSLTRKDLETGFS
jgi:hypothetical protein